MAEKIVKDSQGLAKELVNDCISRREAIDEIKSLYEWHEIVTEDRAIDHFKRLPSAHPEIIHCKDCYYRYGRYCHYRYTNGLFISADHYCGFAKRQEDDK